MGDRLRVWYNELASRIDEGTSDDLPDDVSAIEFTPGIAPIWAKDVGGRLVVMHLIFNPIRWYHYES